MPKIALTLSLLIMACGDNLAAPDAGADAFVQCPMDADGNLCHPSDDPNWAGLCVSGLCHDLCRDYDPGSYPNGCPLGETPNYLPRGETAICFCGKGTI